MKLSSRFLARTAILGALVVIFDYTLKFSQFKIPFPLLPFPWLPFLKLQFDFTGIPIVLALLLVGPESATATSTIAFLAILVRSGNVISAFMKALAEFSTILGMFAGLAWLKKSVRFAKPVSFLLGCITRVLIMTVANTALVVLVYASVPFDFELLVYGLVVVGIFNAIHGLVSMFGGYLVYEALIRRIPSMAPAKNEKSQT
jgi:riboflavin transporter FmnP